MRNAEFVKWCASPKSKRQPWIKVRWINVTSISWDIIKALSFKHEMHPLALEDVLHIRPHNVSKADYFLHHLFLRVLVHEVADESSPTFVAEAEGLDPSALTSKQALHQRKIEQARLDALKQGTLRVSVTPMFVFLFCDGTRFLVLLISESLLTIVGYARSLLLHKTLRPT
ncbi:hypothetical protein MSAN_00285800 [Mycena sanguinolenta]|uniref:Uncharacterized protein n=1 Tax=Mycena sanguinolenta TaxID=230812 RepID=A0A8H7DH20_9AGAR|nr:hypothetical protein MSAN_00285800 [Mycena sanguinolenta]